VLGCRYELELYFANERLVMDMVLEATFYNSKHNHFLPKSINSNHQ
jgi:hypothetical protein